VFNFELWLKRIIPTTGTIFNLRPRLKEPGTPLLQFLLTASYSKKERTPDALKVSLFGLTINIIDSEKVINSPFPDITIRYLSQTSLNKIRI